MTTNMIHSQNSLNGQCAIIGHRGAPAFGGENTLWGFQKALDLGADGFELDVVPTKDGKLIVGHDFDLKRLIGEEQLAEVYPDSRHYVTEFTQEELKKLKVTFPPPEEERLDFRDLKESYYMPTLDQALKLLVDNRKARSRPDLKIYIEIKTKDKFMHTINLNEISAAVTRVLEKHQLLADPNVWIQSFDFKMMDVIAANPLLRENPKCQLAFDGISEIAKFRKTKKARKYLQRKILDRNLQMFHVWKVPSKYILEKKEVPFIDIAHQLGIPVHFYTFRDPNHEKDYNILSALGVQGFATQEEEIAYFMEKGADAIMTDYITSALEVRKKRTSLSVK